MILKKVYTFTLLMLLLVVLITTAANSLKAQVTYEYWWGGVNNDHGYAIAKTPDGNFIIVGSTSSFGVGTPGYTNGFVAKINGSTGKTIWSIWFGTPDYNDKAYDVAVDTQGNIYVTGDYGQYGGIGFLLSLNSSGYPRWAYITGESCRGVTVDFDDNVYAVFYGWSGITSSYDIILLGLTSDGSFRFTQWYYTGLNEYPTGMTTSPNGNVYAIGYRQYPIEGTYYYHIAVFNISRTDGSCIWDRYIGYGANFYGWSLTVDEEENIYIAGSFEGIDVLIVKYNSTLNIENIKRIDLGGNNDEGEGIAIDSSGSIYVVGFTNGVGEGLHDYLVLKYDSNFNLVWAKTWGTSGEDYGRAIVPHGSSMLIFGEATATTGNLVDQTGQVYDAFDLSSFAQTGIGAGSYPAGFIPETVTLTQGSNWDYINTLEPGGTDAVLLSLSSQGEPIPIPEHYNPIITAISIIAAITVMSYVAKRK